MALRPVVETCEPRPDVVRGGLTDAHFAAQLDQVVRSPEAYPVYGDPTEFFAITYPTAGLRELLTSTFGRLSGRGGSVPGAEHGVVRFQTSFGGGKTHGLIAAYHLAEGARPLSIGEFVDPDLLPEVCQVAAAVGDSLGASGSEVEGRRVLTLWGAIAAQLGDSAWEAMGELDEGREVPSTDVWVRIFEERPTLVIIDEIAAYIRAVATSGDPDVRRLADAMPAFLFSLFSAAARVPTARVIVTLATAHDAFGKETLSVEKVLDESSETSREMQSVMSRYREVLVPAEDDEIAEILRRRLFSSIDDQAAEEAAEAFQGYYLELESKEVRLDQGADISERIRKSYPFHPELVRVLDTRVGTIPDFQRTRGALRLLAEAVAALWSHETDTPIINVADLPLDEPAVAGALTRAIGREAFAQVIAADVAGSGSHAAEIDSHRFAGAKPYGSRAATAVFLHSLERTASTGATLVDVWRGTLCPGEDPELVEEALRQLEQSAWHYYYDTSRYRFQTEPNPRKIVEDERAGVPASMVREELDRRIKAVFAPAGPLRTVAFASDPADVDDRPDLQLAVVHYDDLKVTARDASPPNSLLLEMRDTYGTASTNRTFRNGVVFLVADANQVDAMHETVRTHLAAERIVDDTDRLRSFQDEVRKKLEEIADKAGLDARVAITSCYRHLYYPKADRANHHLRHHELSLTDQGDQAKNQTPVIQQALQQVGKIRTTGVSTDFFAKVAGFPSSDPLATNQAVEAFWRDHDADLILDPTLLQDVLVAGIRNGSWIYYDADTEKAYTADSPPPAPRIAATTFLYSQEKAEAEGLLTPPVTWEAIQREVRQAGGEMSGTELRSRLEATLGAEPTKQSITEVLARVVKQSESPIVVAQGEPSADTKPLAPSTVERTSLDRLTILDRERAENIGIELRERPGTFRLPESGPAGQVFARLGDKLAETGGQHIEAVDITHDVATADTSSLRTFLSAVPMLAKVDFDVTWMASATFPEASGDVMVESLTGSHENLAAVQKQLLDLLDHAEDLSATVTLTHRPDQPFGPDSETWRNLSDVFVQLKPGHITVEVRGR